MKTNKNFLKNKKQCVGCGACIEACPHGALIKKSDFYTWIPEIDKSLCKNCGLCARICKAERKISPDTKKAYIAYNTDSKMRLQSASGGVFSALAQYVLQNNGSVYGASLLFENGRAVVKHRRITDVAQMPSILGSKYVQSDCFEVYKEVKSDLRAGKTVLFSGCSCQVNGLKNYLGNEEQANLYTMDLVCHGVPTECFFNRYIRWLQNKYRGKVTNLSFRTKKEGKIVYELTVEFDFTKKVVIPLRDSGYYRMFIGEESYRDACYRCEYASLDKPADITTGDYFEAKKDYPQLFTGENAIDSSSGLSCVITHTNKGEALLHSSAVFLHEVEPEVVQASHGNLHRPSKHSKKRNFLKTLCLLFGYGSMEFFYKIRNKLIDIVKR